MTVMEYAAASFIITLTHMVVAVFTVWAVLRGLDKLNNRPFSIAWQEMRNGSISVGLYYGLRFLGICVLAATILS